MSVARSRGSAEQRGAIGRARRIGSRGQALILYALALVCVLGFVALAIDVGYAYGQRRQAQNAADAAALAGARALALGESVQDAVDNLAAHNGMQVKSIAVNGARVSVQTERAFKTFFASALDQKQWKVSAAATAAYGSPAGVNGLFPLAIKDREFVYGTEYTLFGDEPNPPGQFKLGPGNFGWLDFNGGSNGTPELADWILNGYQGTISVVGGTTIEGDTGMKTAVKDELEARKNRKDSEGNPIPVVLLIYDTATGHGAGFAYHCISFAAFELTEVNFHGDNKYIKGKFIERYVVPALIDPNSEPGENGVKAVGLAS